MPQRREHPYIWATWLPRLLTGENSCEFAPSGSRPTTSGLGPCQPSDFNQNRVARATTPSYSTSNGEPTGNSARLRSVDVEEPEQPSSSAAAPPSLAGKPDLLVLGKDHEAVITDVKTGARTPLAPPLQAHNLHIRSCHEHCPNAFETPSIRRSRSSYPNRTQSAYPGGRMSTNGFVQDLSALIRRHRSAGGEPARRVPSTARSAAFATLQPPTVRNASKKPPSWRPEIPPTSEGWTLYGRRTSRKHTNVTTRQWQPIRRLMTVLATARFPDRPQSSMTTGRCHSTSGTNATDVNSWRRWRRSPSPYVSSTRSTAACWTRCAMVTKALAVGEAARACSR